MLSAIVHEGSRRLLCRQPPPVRDPRGRVPAERVCQEYVVCEKLFGEETVTVAGGVCAQKANGVAVTLGDVAGQRLQLVVELHHDVDELHSVVRDSEVAAHHVGRHSERRHVGAEANLRLLDASPVAHIHILDATLRDARPLLKAAPAALGVRAVVVHYAVGRDGRRDDDEEA